MEGWSDEVERWSDEVERWSDEVERWSDVLQMVLVDDRSAVKLTCGHCPINGTIILRRCSTASRTILPPDNLLHLTERETERDE